MRSKGFCDGFEKTAVDLGVGAALRATGKVIGGAVKTVGKAAWRVAKPVGAAMVAAQGGKFNAGMNAVGAVGDYSDASRKLTVSRNRPIQMPAPGM